jgi:uncharacterized membrane protein YkoI
MGRIKRATARTVVVTAVAAATTVGVAAGGDGEQPQTRDNYERAARSALAHTGGGEVIETDEGDNGAAYEVEVRLGDNRQVEVQIDENFQVVGSQTDEDGPADENDQSED